MTLRLLTLNAFMLPPFVRSNLRPHYKDQRLEALKGFLADYDVVAFQELFGTGSRRRTRFLQWAKGAGFVSVIHSPPNPCCFPKFPRLKAVDGALVIISRYPMIESDSITYTQGMKSDGFSAKGALFCRIQVDDFELDIFTTHTQASYTDGTPQEVEMCRHVRLSQFEQLKEFILSKSSKNRVLMGDLNVDGSVEANYSELMLALSSDSYQIRDLLPERPPTFGLVDANGHAEETLLTTTIEQGTQQSLDYVLWLKDDDDDIEPNGNGQVMPFYVEDQPFTQVSDHCGVAVSFNAKM